MTKPSINVMHIAAADPALFEHLMASVGLRIVPRDSDPLQTNVQEEAVMAVASAITEDAYQPIRLSPYRKQLKEMAEKLGYVVMLEHWHDHEEYQQLNRDAEEGERGFYNDLPPEERDALDAEHDAFQDSYGETMFGPLPQKRDLTGQALLDKVFADTIDQNEQPY